MINLENDRLIPRKPIFNRRYIADIYNKRKENTEDSFFKALHSYNKNIKLENIKLKSVQ